MEGWLYEPIELERLIEDHILRPMNLNQKVLFDIHIATMYHDGIEFHYADSDRDETI